VNRKHLIWGGVAALGVAVLVRAIQAAAGSISGARAASDAGLLVGFALIATLGILALRGARPVGIALVGLALASWGMAVALPLWRVGHPPAPLLDLRLGGARREVPTAPAPVTGRYLIEVDYPPGKHDTEGNGPTYLLKISVGERRLEVAGKPGLDRQTAELVLERGEKAMVFLEHAAATYATVRVRLAPLPWSYVTILGLISLVLAFLAEIVAFRDQPRLRGLLTLVTAMEVIFVALLDPSQAPTGQAALGAAGLGLVGGGIVGALAAAVQNRIYRSRRATAR
jgi:hypothetical protein